MALEPHRQKLLEELSELRLQRLRHVTNEKDLNREVGELIKVYERILEGREGLERLPALLVLSSLYQRTDKPERSVEMAKEAVALNPREVRCHLTLAQAQETVLKKPEEALQTYKQVLLLDPTNQEARERIEKLTETTGRPEDKIKLYAELAQAYPADKQLQELYGKILIKEKRWAQAEAHLKEVIARWPDDMSGRVALLRIWVAQGRIDEAVAEAGRIGQKDRKMAPLVALTVAEALVAQGDRPRALAVLTEFQKKIPANENITMALASMLIDAGQPAQAGKVLEDFHRQRPDFFLASVLLAQVYADQKRYQDAQTLLDSQPESVKKENKEDLLHLQGELYRRQKNWDKALAILEQLILEHKDNAQYYIEAGTIYQETGRNGEAEKHYLQALKLDPEDPEAYNTLGYFYADTNQKLDEALTLVNKALKMKPGAGHILDSLGWVYYRRGDFNTAAEKLTEAVRAMEKAPDSVVYSHLGDVYEKLGKIKEAREAWQKALALDEGAADIKDKLRPHRKIGAAVLLGGIKIIKNNI